MRRIIVSVTNDLTSDQRVYKVCKTLQEMGFDILLVGRKLKTSLPISSLYKTKRMCLIFNKGFMFYAEYNLRLFFLLLVSKKSILLANDLDTLLPNYLISRLQNKKLVYDSHELFTEVPELISRPKIQKTWLIIEEWIFPKLKNCYTVSQSIADYYTLKYKSPIKVIRNVPEKTVSIKSEIPWYNPETKKIILYQGAVNIGRGLELMIESMKYLNNHLLIIIGDGDILMELKGKVGKLQLNKRVQFLERMDPIKLQQITPNADLGISLEEDMGLSYRFSLPNKMFDYINANIPILVSDLPEPTKIIKKYNVGINLLNRNPRDVANSVEAILNFDKTKLEKNLELAKRENNWEIEKVALIKLINSID